MPDFGRKGIGLIFPNLDAEMESWATVIQCGNANDLGFVGGSPGKSSLFFVRG